MTDLVIVFLFVFERIFYYSVVGSYSPSNQSRGFGHFFSITSIRLYGLFFVFFHNIFPEKNRKTRIPQKSMHTFPYTWVIQQQMWVNLLRFVVLLWPNSCRRFSDLIFFLIELLRSSKMARFVFSFQFSKMNC